VSIWVTTWMTQKGSAVDNAAQAPTGQKGAAT
jgi:hypothetical protein